MKRHDLKFCLILVSGLSCGACINIHFPDAQHTPAAWTNSIGMEFVRIPAGSFMMGAEKNFAKANDRELPQHPVTISQPFYLGKYEVTQEQWLALMDNNPNEYRRGFSGPRRPIVNVTWFGAQNFICRLNRKEGTDKYRLPTDAEWEYAARAGTQTRYSFGDDASILGEYAWYADNSGHATHPVGQKKPNPWGLYDMHGNVWEWVRDTSGEEHDVNSSVTDPTGPEPSAKAAEWYVFRGGGWTSSAEKVQSTAWDFEPAGQDVVSRGFRVLFSPGAALPLNHSGDLHPYLRDCR